MEPIEYNPKCNELTSYGHDPSAIIRNELIVVINNTHYKVCSMNIKLQPTEFYYHFAYPPYASNKSYFYNMQKKTGRPDHISFHADGKVHLHLKKGNDLFIQQMPDLSFLPASKNTVTPLLVHSVFPQQEKYILPQINESKRGKDFNMVFNHFIDQRPQNFSVIIFLVPEHINLQAFLMNWYCALHNVTLPLSHLGYLAGRISAWDGWALDCMITDLVLSVPNYKKPFEYHNAFAFCDLNEVFANLLNQRVS